MYLKKLHVSFEVTSLFNNIPADLELKCIEKCWPGITEYTSLKYAKSRHTVSYKIYFSEVFGTAMGSPISFSVVNLFMEETEKEVSALHIAHFFKVMSMNAFYVCISSNKIC